MTGTWGEVRGSFKIAVPITIEDGATVTFRDLKANPDGTFKTSECMPAVECLGDATIILKGSNVARSFHDDAPAVFYPQNKTLTIKGPGSLVAASVVSWNSGAAAIGGGVGLPCGNIVIEGGTIVAQAFLGGAGIGAGPKGGHCGNITIKGGSITATGGTAFERIKSGWLYRGGAGIGGADGGNCSGIFIEGGVVSANGKVQGAGIGSSNGGCGNIKITGGSVIAKSEDSTYEHGFAAGIGAGSGG